MKRHPHLVPLSQEHHHTLALCLRILRAPEQNHENEIAAHLAELLAHFAEEERCFAELWPKLDRADLQRQFDGDHALLRALAASPQYGDAAWNTEFAERLRAHIRFEERELFPAVEPLLAQAV